MQVSIIIPAYNSAATLPVVLSALERQTFSDFEVIVVDDASADQSSAVLASFSTKLNLKVITNPQNLGRSRSRQVGIEQSTGKVLILLDSDIEVLPEYLAVHLDLHGKLTNAVGIGAMRYPPALARKALARYYVRRGGTKLGPETTLPGRYFLSCLASLPRQLYQQIGGFDPSFQHYGGEDQEIGLRLQKAGAALRHLPQAVGFHHHLRSVSEMTREMTTYGRESIPLILKRHPEFSKELFLEDLTDPASSSSGVKWFRSLITAALLYHPLLQAASALENGWLPPPLLTYLIYSAYRRGYTAHLYALRY